MVVFSLGDKMYFKTQIKKILECDVLVVGGGVSGFAAAVSASRCGAKVILAEQNGYLGYNRKLFHKSAGKIEQYRTQRS